MIGVAFMGSGLITPLYEIYQKAFHFSEIALTLIYAAYVLGNIGALLFFGRFSDRIGRRPVAFASIALGVGSMLCFLFATGTRWLYLGRVLSGIAVGLASGTGAAWLSDLDEDKLRATVAATVSNAFGFALGPLLAGAIAQYASAPLRDPFYAYLPILVGAAILILPTRETVQRNEPLSIAALVRPRVGVPREILADFFAPAVTVFGTFALVGFYAALIPTVLAHSLGKPQPIVGGAIVFELAFFAGVAAIAARAVPSRAAMLATLALLLPSVAILLFAQIAHAMPALVVAAAVGALCWGLGYRGSLQVINEIAPQGRRAEVASSYYIVGFVGNSIPVIGVGVITAAANPTTASLTFGCTIAAFAVAALLHERQRTKAAATST
jgi:predicted MFS family arabinose efflux permease